MKKIAFVAGPALGHVGRLLSVISELKLSSNAEIHCFSPDIKGFAKNLFTPLYKTFLVPIQKGNFLEKNECFGIAVNKILTENRYDLIIYDCNPLNWITFMKFNGVPSVCITNVFLTRFGNAATIQENRFAKHKNAINDVRSRHKLSELESSYDLYEADLVLLADPKPIVDMLITKMPTHYKHVGACVWATNEKLPAELKDCRDILLLSMGSTGPASIEQNTFSALKKFIGASISVYTGNKADLMRQHISLDMDFTWLPLDEVLKFTKAVFSQGGSGSTYQALGLGIPTFIMPSHQNHRILGDILTSLGTGLCISSDFEHETLSNYDFAKIQQQASRFGRQMAKENGVKAAAAKILEML